MLFWNNNLLTDQELGILLSCMEQIFHVSMRLWFVPAVKSCTVGILIGMEFHFLQPGLSAPHLG